MPRRWLNRVSRVGTLRRHRRPATRRRLVPGTLLVAALGCGCSPDRPPPPTLLFAGLPVSGDRNTALGAGFTKCIDMDAVHIRCRRHNVKFYGYGPYEAAVDLSGRGGKYGFSQLTIWHDTDDDAIYEAITALARRGWQYCYTGTEQWGDQAIFSRRGEQVRIFIDISYYGKRRLRVIPLWNEQRLFSKCVPDKGFWRFGIEVDTAAVKLGKDGDVTLLR